MPLFSFLDNLPQDMRIIYINVDNFEMAPQDGTQNVVDVSVECPSS